MNLSGSNGLHCYGIITTSSGFSSTSDRNVKEQVQDVNLSHLVDAVDCKSHIRNDKPEWGRRLGFISQDVKEACINLGIPDTFSHEMDEGLLGLDYSRLVVPLWSKCKQLETRLQAIELAIQNA